MTGLSVANGSGGVGSAGPNRVETPPTPLGFFRARGREIKLLGSLRAHRRLAVTVALAVMALGAPIALEKGRHLYYAEATILVSPQFVKYLSAEREHEFQSDVQYRRYVEQQVVTINHYDVCLQALRSLGPRRKAYWPARGESEQQTVNRLQAALTISTVPDSYLISVGLVGERPDGLAAIVNAVTEAYLAKAKEGEFFQGDERIERLEKERQNLRDHVDKKIELRLQLAEKLGVTTFDSQNLNPFDKMVISSREALAEARRARIRAEAALAAVEPAKGKEAAASLNGYAQQYVSMDPGLNSLKANLNQRRSLLVTKLAGMSKTHPGRPSVERELANITEEVADSTRRLFASFCAMILSQRRAVVVETRRVERELNERIASQQTMGASFAKDYQEGLLLGEEVVDARLDLRAIRKRVSSMKLESRAPGFVRIESRALKPVTPYQGGRKKAFMFLFAIAAFLGVVAPLAVDVLWSRVHATSDVMRILGFPPIGWILDRSSQQAREFAEDQAIRLASSLERHCRAEGLKSIVFTSVKPSGGATSLTLDLANRVTELGLRAVALEVNAFSPDERYRAHVPMPGLIDVLERGVDVSSAIIPADGSLPDRIGVGDVPARHLPDIKRVAGVLASLSEMYDIVFLDAPPVLISADAELIAIQAEGVMLVIEAEAVGHGEVRRAARVLDALDLSAVGAIVNRVHVYGNSGYMGELLNEYESGSKRKSPKWIPNWLWR